MVKLMYLKNIKVIFPFFVVITLFSCFSAAAAETQFGNQASFGGSSSDAATEAWIASAVNNVNGVLDIRDPGNGTIKITAADVGGENGFIWQTLVAIQLKKVDNVQNGQSLVLTGDDIEKLATAVIEKYLLHIDSWPDIKALLQTYKFTDEELAVFEKKFEDSVPKPGESFDYNAIQKLFDVSGLIKQDQSGPDGPVYPRTSVLSWFNKEAGVFSVTSGTGRLTGRQSHIDLDEKYTIGPIATVYGDYGRFGYLIKALELINSKSIKDTPYNNNIKSKDFYNCVNYAKDTQEMLENYGIDAYVVSMDNEKGNGHAAIAIKVGDIEYQDGSIVPTFAVIEPQSGYYEGQLGGDGLYNGKVGYLSFSDAYDQENYFVKSDNVIVAKDIHVTTGAEQRIIVQASSGVYTYTDHTPYITQYDSISGSGTFIDY